jgi:hypothetical protein
MFTLLGQVAPALSIIALPFIFGVQVQVQATPVPVPRNVKLIDRPPASSSKFSDSAAAAAATADHHLQQKRQQLDHLVLHRGGLLSSSLATAQTKREATILVSVPEEKRDAFPDDGETNVLLRPRKRWDGNGSGCCGWRGNGWVGNRHGWGW